MKPVKPIVGVILIFLFGALSGSITTYMVCQPDFKTSHQRPKRHSKEEKLLRQFTERLHLDNHQAEQVNEIIKETRSEIRLIRYKSRPEIESAIANSQQRINALLRTDQQETFKKIVEEHKTHRNKNHR